MANLKGRYLTPLIDSPNGTSFKKGEYLEITEDNNKGVVLVGMMQFGNGSYNFEQSQVKLLPEEFKISEISYLGRFVVDYEELGPIVKHFLTGNVYFDHTGNHLDLHIMDNPLKFKDGFRLHPEEYVPRATLTVENSTLEERLAYANKMYPIGTMYHSALNTVKDREYKATTKAEEVANGIEVGRGFVFFNNAWAKVITKEETIDLTREDLIKTLIDKAKTLFPVGCNIISHLGSKATITSHDLIKESSGHIYYHSVSKVSKICKIDDTEWATIVSEKPPVVIPIDEIVNPPALDLTGRYLKVLDAYPISHYNCKKGDYLLYNRKERNGYQYWGSKEERDSGKPYYNGFNCEKNPLFELMPEGFKPVIAKVELIPGKWYTSSAWNEGSYARLSKLEGIWFNYDRNIFGNKLSVINQSWTYSDNDTLTEVPEPEQSILYDKNQSTMGTTKRKPYYKKGDCVVLLSLNSNINHNNFTKNHIYKLPKDCDGTLMQVYKNEQGYMHEFPIQGLSIVPADQEDIDLYNSINFPCHSVVYETNRVNFKKDDYVVLLSNCSGGGTKWLPGIPVYTVYQLSEDSNLYKFRVVKNLNGNEDGWSSTLPSTELSQLRLRAATEKEIALYKFYDGPCDILGESDNAPRYYKLDGNANDPNNAVTASHVVEKKDLCFDEEKPVLLQIKRKKRLVETMSRPRSINIKTK